MDTMNKVFLMGRLGGDPQTHLDKRGISFVRLSVATHKRLKSSEGEEAKKPDWHTVFVWGQRAETCAKYLRKGSPVFVEGFLSTYPKVKAEGPKEWQSSIRAVKVSFLPGGQHVPSDLGAAKDEEIGGEMILEDFVESELAH
ncbi:MAG: single-stranded DNA-binding protein [Bdellovibrionales bacterium]|nr:single-stranded DNA-binding protein [Bdellovibrionales bacterium]